MMISPMMAAMIALPVSEERSMPTAMQTRPQRKKPRYAQASDDHIT